MGLFQVFMNYYLFKIELFIHIYYLFEKANNFVVYFIQVSVFYR